MRRPNSVETTSIHGPRSHWMLSGSRKITAVGSGTAHWERESLAPNEGTVQHKKSGSLHCFLGVYALTEAPALFPQDDKEGDNFLVDKISDFRDNVNENYLLQTCLVYSKTMPNKFLQSYFSAYTKRHFIIPFGHSLTVLFCWISETGHFSTAIYTPTIIDFWCRYGVGTSSLTSALLRSGGKCVSWLTAGWGTWLQLPNWGDSLRGSLWKLTAKHSQLDLRYLERLSFSPWIKAGPDKTCTLTLQQINVKLVACQWGQSI